MASALNRRECEFRLLQYVPDTLRNEFVHIGVILREQGGSEAPRIRFTHDWRRVRCLDPNADTEALESMESELRRRFQDERFQDERFQDERSRDGKDSLGTNLMRLLGESLSNGLQMTEPKGYLAESLPAGLEELMRLYVEPPPKERVPRLSGRAAIQARMRAEFEHVGVWDLLRKRIAASTYTRPGDPLRVDLGYRPNGHQNERVRMFHAVSLDPGVEAAKVLAFSSASLRAGVERVEKAELELTAIVEPAARVGATDDDPERLQIYRFGIETMEEHRIRVLTTSDLGRVAETARREMRV